MNYKLSALMSQYTDKNINNQFEPVAVGRYGIRKRSEIYKKDLASDYSKNKVIYKDTLTIGLGSKQIDVGVLTEDAIYSVSPAYTTFKINTSVVKPQYLELFFKAFNDVLTQKYMIASARQGKKVDIKSMLNEEIFIPDFDIQEQVISNINLLVRAMEKDERIVSLYDELVKARFVEMFGLFPSNEKGWEVGTIRDLVTEVRYGSSRKAAEGNNGKYPYLRMNNITYSGELDLSDTKTIDVPDDELEKCTVRRGDLLFNRTNSKELVGKTCVYNRDDAMVLAGFVIRVRLNERALPEFVSAFLNTDFSKTMLLGMCKEAIGQANINAQEFQNIAIYIPPISLQKDFIEFKEQVDKSKVVIQKRIDLYTELLNKKMDEFFNPEVS